MSVMPGAGGDAGAKLGVILDRLKELEAGQARIANLYCALEARHVRAEQVLELAAAMPHPASGTDAFSQLLTHIRASSRALYFRRPSPPSWDHPVALILEQPLLDEGEAFHLFSQEYIARSMSFRLAPQNIQEASDLDGFLSYIRKGFREGMGAAGLGEPFRAPASSAAPGDGRPAGVPDKPSGRVVFITPVDGLWEQLTAHRFKAEGDPFPAPELATRVCDVLGLPYCGKWLVELRSRLTLSELIAQGGLTLAAPTVFEAWVHDYFRQWPRDGSTDCWGRTLNIGDGGVGRSDPQGLPEAIVDYLSPSLLSEAFEVSILGKVNARPIPPQKAVNDFLVENRELAALVQDIVSRAHSAEIESGSESRG